MNNGDCFSVHARFVLDNPGWTLCHGIVSGQGELEGKRYCHAWVELNGRVAEDMSNGQDWVMDARDYRKLGKADNVKEYSRKEVLDWMLKSEHYGPWEIEETEDERRMRE